MGFFFSCTGQLIPVSGRILKLSTNAPTKSVVNIAAAGPPYCFFFFFSSVFHLGNALIFFLRNFLKPVTLNVRVLLGRCVLTTLLKTRRVILKWRAFRVRRARDPSANSPPPSCNTARGRTAVIHRAQFYYIRAEYNIYRCINYKYVHANRGCTSVILRTDGNVRGRPPTFENVVENIAVFFFFSSSFPISATGLKEISYETKKKKKMK